MLGDGIVKTLLEYYGPLGLIFLLLVAFVREHFKARQYERDILERALKQQLESTTALNSLTSAITVLSVKIEMKSK